MHLARFLWRNRVRWGVVDGEDVRQFRGDLYPGDIISTGCPGSGEIKVGDTVEVEIEGIGILRNPVVADR